MKTLYDIIIEEAKKNKIKIANLYDPLSIAIKDPSTGIKLVKPKNKTPLYIIRDSALVSREFLPIKCYITLGNNKFKKKFTKKQIEDFVIDTQEKDFAKVLLKLILSEANVENEVEELPSTEIDDIYGEYSYSSYGDDNSSDIVNKPENSTVSVLCNIFQITS